MYYPLPRGVVRWISLQKSEYRERERERERDKEGGKRARKVRGKIIDGKHRCLCLKTDSGSRSN